MFVVLCFQQKGMLMSNLLIPVMDKFKSAVSQLLVEVDEQQQELLAQYLCHAMAVTSRASKAFTNHQTMKSCCCVPVFVEATKVFLRCLQVMWLTAYLYHVNQSWPMRFFQHI